MTMATGQHLACSSMQLKMHSLFSYNDDCTSCKCTTPQTWHNTVNHCHIQYGDTITKGLPYKYSKMQLITCCYWFEDTLHWCELTDHRQYGGCRQNMQGCLLSTGLMQAYVQCWQDPHTWHNTVGKRVNLALLWNTTFTQTLDKQTCQICCFVLYNRDTTGEIQRPDIILHPTMKSGSSLTTCGILQGP